ncbi:MAG: L,D-transpeptidase [Candidatus Portnoybacteria bacterium]|nr:L,D-transpeptidase [Candidatus Portnoybacteria bacterium]
MKTLVLLFFCLTLFSGGVSARNDSSGEYSIEVSVSRCRLYLYDISAGGKRLVKEYAAATAKKGLGVYPSGNGYVTKIEFQPAWLPTAYSRWYFKTAKNIDLPAFIPPGHPQNYMGSFKIHLSHQTSKGSVYRIHGNNDSSLIGKRVTGGCIRLHNGEGEELAGRISVGTKVIIKN